MSKILIADQDKYLSRLLKASLELDGFKVTIAFKNDLIEKAESEIPDLILLGLEDGLEICIIRGQPLRRCPTVGGCEKSIQVFDSYLIFPLATYPIFSSSSAFL